MLKKSTTQEILLRPLPTVEEEEVVHSGFISQWSRSEVLQGVLGTQQAQLMKNDYRIKAKDTVTEVKRGLIATIISLSPRTPVEAILCLERKRETRKWFY